MLVITSSFYTWIVFHVFMGRWMLAITILKFATYLRLRFGLSRTKAAKQDYLLFYYKYCQVLPSFARLERDVQVASIKSRN